MGTDWEYGPVEKRGGCWGFFRTHKPTGRSQFVTNNGCRTKALTEALRRSMQAATQVA